MSDDLVPSWIAALHGHAYQTLLVDSEPPPNMPNNPWIRAACLCGWRSEEVGYEDTEHWFKLLWSEHVAYEIATSVRVET